VGSPPPRAEVVVTAPPPPQASVEVAAQPGTGTVEVQIAPAPEATAEPEEVIATSEPPEPVYEEQVDMPNPGMFWVPATGNGPATTGVGTTEGGTSHRKGDSTSSRTTST